MVGVHKQRALTNSECGRRADADNALLIFAERVCVGLPQRLKRGPGLSARRDVLALLLADDAMRRHLRALGILRAACGADEEGHCSNSLPHSGREILEPGLDRLGYQGARVCEIAVHLRRSYGEELNGGGYLPFHRRIAARRCKMHHHVAGASRRWRRRPCSSAAMANAKKKSGGAWRRPANV